MALFTGKTGNVAIAGTDPFYQYVANVTDWNGSLDNTFAPGNTFADTSNGVKEVRLGYQMTGTITGYLPAATTFTIADVNPIAGTSSLTLTTDTGKTFAFEAHLHNFRPNISATPNALASFTVDYRSHGDITPA